MKVVYQCSDCKRYYESAAEAHSCEAKHIEEKRKEEEREMAKIKEREELNKLLDDYCAKASELNALVVKIIEKGGTNVLFDYLFS